jgi:hypothetical protein
MGLFLLASRSFKGHSIWCDFCISFVHTNLKRSDEAKFKGKIMSTNLFFENYKDLQVCPDADLETIEHVMGGSAIKSTGVDVIEEN